MSEFVLFLNHCALFKHGSVVKVQLSETVDLWEEEQEQENELWNEEKSCIERLNKTKKK